MKLVNAATMRAIDHAASADLGAISLMRHAGRSIAQLVRKLTPPGRIVAFAGPGNNGGDALAACAELHPEYTCVVYTDDHPQASESREDALQRARAANVCLMPMPQNRDEAQHALEHAEYILDGLLGVGARNETSIFAHLIEAVNAASGCVLALDLPTGINATDGSIASPIAVKADHTLFLGLPKYGAFLYPAREYTGTLWLADIGIATWENIHPQRLQEQPDYRVITAHEAAALLPQRAETAEKRSAGAPLLIAGSADFPGAAILCVLGAARMGAGYVTVGTPTTAMTTLRQHLIEQVVFGFDDTDVSTSLSTILQQSKHAGSIAIGPGMSLHETTGVLLRRIIQETSLPLVIDASALRHLHGHLELLRHRDCVITPHAGEFAHLTGSEPFLDSERVERLQHFLQEYGITTLLKGNPTLIADASTIHLNPTGTNTLATAGTGDVLTGMIATLLSQGLRPIDAAGLGAYLHGLAGQYAQHDRIHGIIAGDLPEHLRDAWHGLKKECDLHPSSLASLQRLDSLSCFPRRLSE